MKVKEIDRASALIGGAGGLGLGLLAGFYLARRLLQRSADQRIASEIEATKAHYLARINAARKRDHGDGWAAASMGDSGTDTPGGDISEQDRYQRFGFLANNPGIVPPRVLRRVQDAPQPGDPGYEDALEGLPGHGDSGDDGDGNEDDDGEEDTDLVEPDKEVPDPGPEVDRTKPYMIKDYEFFSEMEHYNKISITYYEGDKTLVDDREMPILNPASVAGADFASHFGDDPEDPNTVYVRNEKLEADFEISKDGRGYAEVILNYGRPT